MKGTQNTLRLLLALKLLRGIRKGACKVKKGYMKAGKRWSESSREKGQCCLTRNNWTPPPIFLCSSASLQYVEGGIRVNNVISMVDTDIIQLVATLKE